MNGVHPTFWIETWGCQTNEADSSSVARLLEGLGYRAAESAVAADVILLNTCCVRAKPEQKVYSRLGELRRIKEQSPETVIAVAGCMAQKEGERLRCRAPQVDLVIGTQQLHRLPELIMVARRTRRPQVEVSLNGTRAQPRADWLASAPWRRQPLKALINIMQGCTNYCSYCIVPSVRGPERSRRSEEIVCEVQTLAAGGCREVTLLGQNVLAYGRDLGGSSDFVSLLELLEEIPALERIRFTTTHPRDVDEWTIEAIARLPKVCEHIHMPLQAGDDDLLRAMGRGYTAAHYLALVGRVRAAISGVSITSDLIVGFPGETDKQFERSLEAYRQVRFDQAFMFAYSPREGTRAASLPGQLPAVLKQERLARLIALQNEISTEINHGWVGRVEPVLVEGPSEHNPDRFCGRTRNNKLVMFAGDESLIGQVVPTKLVSAHLWGWEGERA